MKQQPLQQGQALFEFIPQRPPFVMVDKLFEKGEDYVLTGFSIAIDNILVENGHFLEGGLVENIAQSAALFAGLRFAEQGKAMPVGYIAGIKKLAIESTPPAGSRIYTRIKITHDLDPIQVVEGTIFDENDQRIAACELRIFIKEEV